MGRIEFKGVDRVEVKKVDWNFAINNSEDDSGDELISGDLSNLERVNKGVSKEVGKEVSGTVGGRCDRCGLEFEEFYIQENGEGYCRACHIGMGRGFDEEEYVRMRRLYDRDEEFKKLRHRYWSLGLARRTKVLRDLGFWSEDEEVLNEKLERYKLYLIKAGGMEIDLDFLIREQELELQKMKENVEYLSEVAHDSEVAHTDKLEELRNGTKAGTEVKKANLKKQRKENNR